MAHATPCLSPLSSRHLQPLTVSRVWHSRRLRGQRLHQRHRLPDRSEPQLLGVSVPGRRHQSLRGAAPADGGIRKRSLPGTPRDVARSGVARGGALLQQPAQRTNGDQVRNGSLKPVQVFTCEVFVLCANGAIKERSKQYRLSQQNNGCLIQNTFLEVPNYVVTTQNSSVTAPLIELLFRSSFILSITYPQSSVTLPLAGPSGRRPPGM